LQFISEAAGLMKNYPLRLAIFYFLVASLWIFLSDYFTELLVPSKFLTTAQSIKGFGFIIVTALGLFFVVRYQYQRLQRNEAEYRQLFKDNPHPMWVYDTETLRFLTVNNAAIQKYRYTKEEFRELKITDIRPPEDRDSILMFVKRIEQKTYLDSGLWRHVDKNGRQFFVRIASHSTTFGDRPARVVLAMDVDEQIEAQRRIQLSESKLKGLINNSDDLIWMLDAAGIIVTANEAFQSKFREFLGIEIELSKRIDVSQLPDSGFTKNWNNYFKLAFLGKRLRVEEEVKNGDRTECYEIILNPIYNDNRQVFGVGCFARDITLRKSSENRIKEQIIQLKEVAWIQSHEVRKPLANIMGLLQLFKSRQTDAAQNKELLDHMETSCKELDAVVKKIVEKSSTDLSSET
jgi:PAS domain S-box-containing protein